MYFPSLKLVHLRHSHDIASSTRVRENSQSRFQGLQRPKRYRCIQIHVGI